MRAKKMRRGKCRICGCTEMRACRFVLPSSYDDGVEVFCWWTDKTKTLCSNPDCVREARAK